ncbi:MAG: CBS domain-containing protein [Myxococcales bacterium]|nr:CBS domain-containing protein [Myxococcales bacterium]
MIAHLAPRAAPFDQPVATYMSRALEIAHLDTPIEKIAAAMDARRISGVPVVDATGLLTGVVTRTDLIALGALQAGRRALSPAMPLPRRTAREVMSLQPQSISIRSTMRDAARIMATHAIHRVFVTEGPKLIGVVGAVDIAAVVHDAKISVPLSTIMSTPLVSVSPRAPLASAIELLDRLRVNALVVLDDGHALGVFTQTEALAARDLPRSTPIEALFDPAMVCLPSATPLYRAAGQVARLDVRRVIVCSDRDPVGLVTALDFARYVAW